ncbi:hypothetical protein J6590_069712 [Homalodisca vitripennis]|nr:hypothetical protein J6590_069712 [Homalodisca vitripennis]
MVHAVKGFGEVKKYSEHMFSSLQPIDNEFNKDFFALRLRKTRATSPPTHRGKGHGRHRPPGNSYAGERSLGASAHHSHRIVITTE